MTRVSFFRIHDSDSDSKPSSDYSDSILQRDMYLTQPTFVILKPKNIMFWQKIGYFKAFKTGMI